MLVDHSDALKSAVIRPCPTKVAWRDRIAWRRAAATRSGGAPLTGCAVRTLVTTRCGASRLRRSASVQLAANGKRPTTLRVAPVVPTTRAPRGWLHRDQQIAATRVAKIPTSEPVAGPTILGRQHRVSRTGLGGASGRLDPVGWGEYCDGCTYEDGSYDHCVSVTALGFGGTQCNRVCPSDPGNLGVPLYVATRFTLPVLHVAANR